tara:strand:+ start:1160 stop:1381 length:222 start_codon:yes stop_codon:yes gene_type:complete
LLVVINGSTLASFIINDLAFTGLVITSFPESGVMCDDIILYSYYFLLLYMYLSFMSEVKEKVQRPVKIALVYK